MSRRVSIEGKVPVWWPMSGLDLIPDAETALKIGRVILEKYYGDGLACRYEPYRASPDPIDAEEWVVYGSRDDTSVTRLGGGFPELSIARRDAGSQLWSSHMPSPSDESASISACRFSGMFHFGVLALVVLMVFGPIIACYFLILMIGALSHGSGFLWAAVWAPAVNSKIESGSVLQAAARDDGAGSTTRSRGAAPGASGIPVRV
jgi:hypothetical protein